MPRAPFFLGNGMAFSDDLDTDAENVFLSTSEYGKTGYSWRTSAGVTTSLASVAVEELVFSFMDGKAWKKFFIWDQHITLTLANRGDRIVDPDGSQWDVMDIQIMENMYVVRGTKPQVIA